jgi:hypothetical protein
LRAFGPALSLLALSIEPFFPAFGDAATDLARDIAGAIGAQIKLGALLKRDIQKDRYFVVI